MLPQTMWLDRTVEEQLQQLKAKTGITPNILSRIAFFRSIEAEFIYHPRDNNKLAGSLKLDKFTWLGKTQLVTELLLKQNYPELNGKELQIAWASHVEHGIASLRNLKSINTFIDKTL